MENSPIDLTFLLKTMERNSEIMLAVFEKFLENPAIFEYRYLSGNEIEKHFPPHLTADARLLRWHIVMLLDEFVLDFESNLINDWSTSDLYPEELPDRLNWSGYAVLQNLREVAKKNPKQH
jgi:hypothetical protein